MCTLKSFGSFELTYFFLEIIFLFPPSNSFLSFLFYLCRFVIIPFSAKSLRVQWSDESLSFFSFLTVQQAFNFACPDSSVQAVSYYSWIETCSKNVIFAHVFLFIFTISIVLVCVKIPRSNPRLVLNIDIFLAMKRFLPTTFWAFRRYDPFLLNEVIQDWVNGIGF